MKRILSVASVAAIALTVAACGDNGEMAEMDVTADSIEAALDEQERARTVRRVEVAAMDERDAAAASFIRPSTQITQITQTAEEPRVVVRGERNDTLARTGGLTGNMIAGVDPRVGEGGYGD